MREVVFTKDFATKKKGDIFKCDGMLARTLINEKVAKYKVKTVSKKKTKK